MLKAQVLKWEDWYQKWQSRLKQEGTSPDRIQNLMKQNNPVVIPRNYRVEEALEAAITHHDYDVLIALLKVITNPYNYDKIDKSYMEMPDSNGCMYRMYSRKESGWYRGFTVIRPFWARTVFLLDKRNKIFSTG